MMIKEGELRKVETCSLLHCSVHLTSQVDETLINEMRSDCVKVKRYGTRAKSQRTNKKFYPTF